MPTGALRMGTMDAEIIQDSFAYLSPVMSEVAERFYERLFAREPRLRALFPIDMKPQRDHFVAAIGSVVGHAHDLKEIEAVLLAMGARHVRYGAKAEQYAMICDELVAALGEKSEQENPGSWTPETGAAWHRALTAVSATMQRGAAEAKGTASA